MLNKKYSVILFSLLLLGCSKNYAIMLDSNINTEEVQKVTDKNELSVVVVANYEENIAANKLVDKVLENKGVKVYKLNKKAKNNEVIVNVTEGKTVRNIILNSDIDTESVKISNYIKEKCSNKKNKNDYILDKDDLKSINNAVDLKKIDEIASHSDSLKYYEKLITSDETKSTLPKYIEEVSSTNFKLVKGGYNQYNYFETFKQNKDGTNYKLKKIPVSTNDPDTNYSYNLEFFDNEGISIIKMNSDESTIRRDLYDRNDSQFAYILDHNMERISTVYIIDKLNNKTYIVNQLSYVNNDRAYIQYKDMFGAFDFKTMKFFPLIKLKKLDNPLLTYTKDYTGTDLAFMGFDDAKLQITPNTLFYYPSNYLDGSEKLTIEYNINDIVTYNENRGLKID